MPHRKKHEEQTSESQEMMEERQEEISQEVPDEAALARVEELERELESANNERLRAIADFQNFRRRTREEMDTFRRLATENLVADLLPVLDNFERTVKHLQSGADVDKMLQGILAVERQLRSVLESQNVRRIESQGKPFDPEIHEAVAIETTSEHPHDMVIDELEPGYKIGDRVIRPARVRVAKTE